MLHIANSTEVRRNVRLEELKTDLRLFRILYKLLEGIMMSIKGTTNSHDSTPSILIATVCFQ